MPPEKSTKLSKEDKNDMVHMITKAMASRLDKIDSSSNVMATKLDRIDMTLTNVTADLTTIKQDIASEKQERILLDAKVVSLDNSVKLVQASLDKPTALVDKLVPIVAKTVTDSLNVKIEITHKNNLSSEVQESEKAVMFYGFKFQSSGPGGGNPFMDGWANHLRVTFPPPFQTFPLKQKSGLTRQ